MNRKLTLFLALSGLLVLLWRPCAGQSALFIDALQAKLGGNYPETVRLFEQELLERPDNAAACFYLGESLLALHAGKPGQYPEAILRRVESLLRKAVSLEPGNYWYKYFLSSFYARTDRVELSAALLEELMASNPGKSDLYFDAARAYIAMDDVEKALASLDKIEARAGRNDMICLTKMEFLTRKNNGDETEAMQYLESYYREYQSPRIATMLGDWYQQSFRDSLAVDRYTQALEMDEHYTPAYYGRAHAYQQMGQYLPYFQDMTAFMRDAAVLPALKAEYLDNLRTSPQMLRSFRPELDTLVSAMLETHPRDSTVTSSASMFAYRCGDYDRAKALMKANTEYWPDSYPIGFQYLLMLYYTDDYETAVDQATVLAQRYPEDSDALLVRASLFSRQKQYAAAIADYEALAARRPKDSLTIVSTQPALGDLYYHTGQVKKAFKCFEKALRVDPDNTLVLNNYAYFLSLEGKNLKKAKAMSAKAIAAEPDNPTYLDTYAWILHLTGQHQEAKAMFKSAMVHGGKEHAEILDHYAEVLYALKEYDLAYIYWNQAKSLNPDLGIDEKIRRRKEAERR